MVVGRSHPAWRGVTTSTEFYSQVHFKIGDQIQRGPSTFFSFPLHKKQKYWAAKGVGGETEMPDVPTEIAAAAGRWARPGAVIQQRGSSTRRRRGGKRCWMKPPQEAVKGKPVQKIEKN
ncbi:hypothetical protein BRADI_2g60245v3 [Brachypodium distachyon]|uniref:Uncharacterized protein n=1 Tax=Brachypodium distachyon TaxID=15368 RepID=A0A2K2DGZ2_BRADI|nr:hypothetical protein BRADI_2g60245v3 [Brachypodium distachyon]